MTWFCFDPRHDIRRTIGTSIDFNQDNKDEYCLSFLDDKGDTQYIPILMPDEVRSNEPYPMPYIEAIIISTPAMSRGLNGGNRQSDCRLQYSIWFTMQETSTCTEYGKKAAAAFITGIQSHQASTPSSYFIDVTDEGQELIENLGKMVVFNRILEVYARQLA